jgi:3'-phosphoadenosine 5'-phosphosulfate (PAPS) 3'-phosphatase
MEWDIAAGRAVAAAARASASASAANLQGNELAYGKAAFENPHFVVWGRPD